MIGAKACFKVRKENGKFGKFPNFSNVTIKGKFGNSPSFPNLKANSVKCPSSFNSSYMFCKIGMHVEQAKTCLTDYTNELNDEEASKHNGLNIPFRSDGSKYCIYGLADNQKQAMALVIQHSKLYCESKLSKENMTMRLTVSGVAGSGKSTWINMLVLLVRQLLCSNNTIGVFGQTGSAAFNAGVETFNKGFRVPIPIKGTEVPDAKRNYLQRKFCPTIAIVIDERSMLEADKLGCIKHYMDETAHGGISNMDWGGIPLVVLVGDDYQIPPIGYGAFHSFSPIKKIEDNKPINPGQLACRMIGLDEFKASAKNVVYLDGVKRVNSEQDQLQRILRNLRCEDDDKTQVW
jgi:hypothetical protein